MAGCSKNNPQQPDPDAWVHDLSLPVPIQFGSPLPVTKAVGFVDASDLNGIDIGVYGLDKSADAVWNLQDLTSGDVILANKKGTITGGSIDLEGGPYYYPRVSDKNYTFYGYYPKTSPTTSDGGGLYVNVPLVNTDVLWARAEAKGDGYNAMYLRKIRSGSIVDEVPTFNFEHSTTGLKFIAKANLEGGIHNDNDFTTTKITKVRVLDVYHNGQLCVAHQTNKALEGSIRPIGEKSNAKIEELDEAEYLDEDFEIQPKKEEVREEIIEENVKPLVSDLKIIGITGTNGKTTSCYLLYHKTAIFAMFLSKNSLKHIKI